MSNPDRKNLNEMSKKQLIDEALLTNIGGGHDHGGCSYTSDDCTCGDACEAGDCAVMKSAE
jgi:hypothetical protein